MYLKLFIKIKIRFSLAKDTFAFLLLERRAHPPSSFSESPPSNHATMSNYQV
ncbi:hypothetical protein [Aneurinibacillus migulanus]|uniref:hypothetical protein n=1 Tax=Aneurinibacillus migulanus TaxID=47500 RepID=UPI001F3082EB|nr:hypothetical protein [Aneurinibacillus migulanus]